MAEDGERMRKEYEFKIATMQTRITGLERDLEDVQEREQRWMESENRVRTMEQELSELRRVSRRLDFWWPSRSSCATCLANGGEDLVDAIDPARIGGVAGRAREGEGHRGASGEARPGGD